MTKNYDKAVEINHNLKWPHVPDHPYRILIFGGLGSGKTNVLLKLIKYQNKILAKRMRQRSTQIKVSIAYY